MEKESLGKMAIKTEKFSAPCRNPLSKHSTGGVLRIWYMKYFFIFKSQAHSVPRRGYITYCACLISFYSREIFMKLIRKTNWSPNVA